MRNSLVVVWLALAALACSGAATGDAGVSGGGGVVGATPDGSEFSVGAAATLPAAWPADVPAPPGGKLTFAVAGPSAVAGRTDVTATWESSDTPAAVVKFYESELPATWTKTMVTVDDAGATAFFSSAEHDRTLSVTVAAGSPGTIGIIVAHLP